MISRWQNVPLGKFLLLRNEFVTIDDFIRYKRARNQWYGKGILLRDKIWGSEIKTKQQQIVHEGDFVVAEIDAKEGSFGVVPPELEAAIVSSHYYVFQIDEKICSRFWLDLACKANIFKAQVVAQGSTNYSAVKPSQILTFTIPLPPLTEQRRIVERIEALAGRVTAAQELRREAREETTKFINHAKRNVFPLDGDTVVKNFADIQSGYAFKSEWFTPNGIRLVRNVNIGHGDIRWNDTASIAKERYGDFPSFELKEGDILISLDRPIISSGLKAARVQKQDLPSLLLQRVGRVVFKNDRVLPEFFFEWLHSPSFVSYIDPGRSNGVPHISQKDIERIPFTPPSLEEQRRRVAYLERIQAKVSVLRAAQAETERELDALLPSVLERAFKGEL